MPKSSRHRYRPTEQENSSPIVYGDATKRDDFTSAEALLRNVLFPGRACEVDGKLHPHAKMLTAACTRPFGCWKLIRRPQSKHDPVNSRIVTSSQGSNIRSMRIRVFFDGRFVVGMRNLSYDIPFILNQAAVVEKCSSSQLSC